VTSKQAFAPKGLLALRQTAFGLDYGPPATSALTRKGDVAIVEVRGPLLHHANPCFESYESILARVALALEEKPKHLVLSLDSPGGLVAGLFETVGELRALAATAGVPVTAYVDGAAYALACAADRIVVPPTGTVGSIGVLDALVSTAEADAASGVQVRLISSGRRKTDGSPHVPITDEAEIESQRHVDYLAGLFFDLVASARSVPREQIAALEAGCEIGAVAVEKKLADEVISLSALIARLNSESETNNGNQAMTDFESILDLLKQLIEKNESPEEVEKAKRMLETLAAPKEEEQPAAEKSEEEPVAEDEIKDPQAAKQVRSFMLASRTDLSKEMIEALNKAPVSTVAAVLQALPRAAMKTPITTVKTTRGEGEANTFQASAMKPEDKAALDRVMRMETPGRSARKAK
jgi:ClpP class serine protease